MVRENREYRYAPLFTEVRSDSERTYRVEGYASTFDEYELFKDGETSYCERIEQTAFDGCDMSDCVFLLDHTGRVYARTRNGSVGLNTDNHGLHCDIDLSRSSASRAVMEDIECGNYDKMSFAFTVLDDAVEHDKENNKYLRTIKRIGKLYDISAVGHPANGNTTIGVSLRSAFDGFIEAEKLELAKAEEIEKRKARIRILLEVNK